MRLLGGTGGRLVRRRGTSAARLEKGLEFFGGRAAEAGQSGDLFDGRLAQAPNRSKPSKQELLALFPHAGELVEHAFPDSLQAELRVVSVGETVGFVPHALEQAESA